MSCALAVPKEKVTNAAAQILNRVVLFIFYHLLGILKSGSLDHKPRTAASCGLNVSTDTCAL
jgi:hypothetical protein